MAEREGASNEGDLQRLPWTFELLSDFSDAEMESLPVAKGTRIAVEGRLDRDAFVYLVQIGDDQGVDVLYPEGGESPKVAAGVPARVPPEGWARATRKGRVRAIASPRPVSVSELVEILKGREPAPGNANIKNAWR